MKMFQELIGQNHIKSSLGFYAAGAKAGAAVPPILFTGARGLGKTEFAREFGKSLKKPILEINCSTIRSVTSFMEQIFMPVVMGNEVVLIFDECHALPKDLQNAFLTIFNVEKQTKKHFEWQGSSMEFDFLKQAYLFATTEPDKIFTPLKDRFEEIDFRAYTGLELGQILTQRIQHVKFADGVIDEITDTLRGNARSAVKRSKQIEIYCEQKNKSTFDLKDWESLCNTLGIEAGGLSNAEIQVLQILKERGGCTLNMLSAATGISRTALQRSVEMFLLQKGYMKVEGVRKITGMGLKVLEEVNA